MPVIVANDQSFEQEVLKSRLPVVVDFWASWCGPCLAAAPVIEELAAQYEGKVKVVKVSTEESQVQPGKYGVAAIPTVILFRDGKEVARQVGFAGKEGYEKLMRLAVGE
jgi:thioredoxin 1